MTEVKLELMTQNELYDICGGDVEDHQFGYKVGRFAKTAYNAVCDACDSAWNWVTGLFD